jgi:hypothetical protein
VGCTCGEATCTAKLPYSLAVGSYIWWIQPWNDAGYGPWSDALAFTITSNLSTDQAEKILGTWFETWLIGTSSFFDQYKFTSLREDPQNLGDWYATGTNQYNDSVSAIWSESLKLYKLTCTDFSWNEYITFDFSGKDSIAGCHYYNGTCYKMTATRTAAADPEPIDPKQ